MSDDDYWDYVREEYEEERFLERVSDEISELADSHFKEIFRSRVALWSEKLWPDSERVAFRVGTEGRAFARDGLYAPAVVWSATCIEIVVREMIIKPVFVGLFIGGDWVESAVGRHGRQQVGRRKTHSFFLGRSLAVAQLDVTTLEIAGTRVWGEIPGVLAKRNRIVHRGEEATEPEAKTAVDVAAGLYGGVLPTMRDLCGLNGVTGYSPPEAGSAPHDPRRSIPTRL